MRRRDFVVLAGVGTVAAIGHSASAQTAKVPRVAIASAAIPPEEMQIGKDINWSALLDQLENRGFREGKTIVYDRYLVTAATVAAAGDNARRILADKPDAIFFGGTPNTALATMALNKEIPMVVENSDLLGQGFVTNLSRPGGNVTGVSTNAGLDTEGKQVSLLAEAVPQGRILAYANSGTDGQFLAILKAGVQSAADAASRLGLKLIPIVYASGGGQPTFEKAFAAIADAKADMVMFGNNTALTSTVQQSLVANMAAGARLPSMAADGGYARAGGLLCYGPNYPSLARRCGDYIADILRGAKPGDMPVRQPEVFDFIVNLKTAKAIGVTIPATVLAQATQVIE